MERKRGGNQNKGADKVVIVAATDKSLKPIPLLKTLTGTELAQWGYFKNTHISQP